jgi:hypothetical protein
LIAGVTSAKRNEDVQAAFTRRFTVTGDIDSVKKVAHCGRSLDDAREWDILRIEIYDGVVRFVERS